MVKHLVLALSLVAVVATVVAKCNNGSCPKKTTQHKCNSCSSCNR